MKRQRNGGFTLIELVIVIIVLAILAATVLPRFTELSGEAERGALQATSAAFSSAVVLARAQWTARGAPGAVENLSGFGRGNLNVSSKGWPVSVNGSTDPAGITAQDCSDLWGALLQSNAPVADITGGDGVEYLVSLEGGACRYRYLKGEAGHYFEYDPEEGEVVTILN